MALIYPRRTAWRTENRLPNTVGINAPYEAIAPGQKGDERVLLSALASLSRDDALFACARVNTIATGFDMTMSHTERQVTLAQQYFNQRQLQAVDKYVRDRGGIEKAAIFFEGQVLELARWVAMYCVHNPNDGETFKDPQLRSEFGRAALIATDLWNDRVYTGRFGPENTPEEQLKKVLGPFRKGGEQAGLAEHSGIAMARAWVIFTKYLPARMPDFDELFEKATRLAFRTYFTCVSALMMRTFPKFEGGVLFNTEYIRGDKFRAEFERFIALRAQSPEAFAKTVGREFEKYEFKALRTRPIISFSRGRSVILDPIYYTESLTVGPLFDLLEVADHREVFGYFGHAFEDYILDFLRGMFPGTPLLPSRLSHNVKGKNTAKEEFECDAILNDVTEAFVLEIKATTIREDVVLTNDPEDFVKELLKKYGVTTHGDKPSDRKGVAQLARSVAAIARREWLGTNGELKGVRRVFPVLVVHDQRVALPGIASYLNLVFLRLLGDIPPTCRVENLIILTVADVENLSTSIENFGFTDLLKDYSAAIPSRGISVLNWMYESKYAKLAIPPAKLWDTLDTIMEGVKAELLPSNDRGELV